MMEEALIQATAQKTGMKDPVSGPAGWGLTSGVQLQEDLLMAYVT